MNKILCLILILAAVLSAQFKEKEDFDPRQRLISSNSSGGILDLNKLSIDQTYSMGYSSSGKNSMMTGSYVAGLNYQLADPLKLNVQLAASFVPYTSFSLPSDQQAQFYFKSATLDYRPNDTFRMVLAINHNPGGINNWNSYDNRFGMFGDRYLTNGLLEP